MSRFNLPECENKSLDNHANSEKAINLHELKDVDKLSDMPELINSGRKITSNNFCRDIYSVRLNSIYSMQDENSDIKKTSGAENKKSMSKSIKDGKSKFVTNLNDIETEFEPQLMSEPQSINSEGNESIPLVNIFTYSKGINAINNSQKNLESYRESYPTKAQPQKVFVRDTHDNSNISSITTAYNVNGYHGDRIKTASSCGSSFITNKHPHAMFIMPNSQIIENSEYCYHNKPIKSQNVHFTQQTGDFVDGDDFQVSSGNTRNVLFKKDSNNKLNDCGKCQMVNNSKILIPCSVSRKEAVLIQQPDCYESEIYTNLPEICCERAGNHVSGESIEVNASILRENTLPTEYSYPNNCYSSQFHPHDSRKNISYVNQQIPIQLIPIQGPLVLNTSINSNFQNMNAFSHYCLTPMAPSYIVQEKPNNCVSALSDPKIKNTVLPDGTDSFISKPELQEESQIYFTPEPVKPDQIFPQFSSNNELNRISSFPVLPSTELISSSNILESEESNFQTFSQPNLSMKEFEKTNIQQEISNDIKPTNKQSPAKTSSIGIVKKIGKFMVTSVSLEDEPINKLPDNLDIFSNINQTIPVEASDDIPKLDRPQQHSRFKKTRIRETIEIWCTNGLNTYDCRFKIIPSKIMNLYNSTPDYLSKEINFDQNCAKCDTHDKEKYCQDENYHMKEFKFWHNGKHIDLCSELENDIENYCPFHAKILKLLNQNQNLSLSKYSSNSFDFSENKNLTSQMFQTVLISSPEHDNYIINVDAQASQILLSAPPVSPSIMNTASVSSLPTNIQSPRSAPTMVMLKCSTPVMLSSAARNTTLFNESITIEKINQRTSNMASESDNNSIYGQHIIGSDNSPMVDLWQSSPLTSDQLAFKLSSPTYVAGTVLTGNSNMEGQIFSHQQPLYPVDHMSPLYYPVYHQSLPSISTTMITNKCYDHNAFLSDIDESSQLTDLPADLIEEINKSTNTFKSIIGNIFQIERNKLLDEIKKLKNSNEVLSNELQKMKTRSLQLEKLLKKKDTNKKDLLTRSENSLISSRDYQPSDFDYNNLI